MIWPFKRHKHEWDGFAPFKRRCACGREEWLFQSIIPRVGLPGLAWKDMTIPASADTHPKDGDVKQAPLVSGAVAKPDAQNTGEGGLR